MGFLLPFGICCACLSVWAIIQLTLMGVFYHIETPILIHDCAEHHASDYNEYIKLTHENYKQTAMNCWIVAGAYAVTLCLSCGCIGYARRKERARQKLLASDEYVCAPKQLPGAKEIDSGLSAKQVKKLPKTDESDEPDEQDEPKMLSSKEDAGSLGTKTESSDSDTPEMSTVLASERSSTKMSSKMRMS